MAGKRLNPRRAKINHCYTVEELARLFDVHRQTVRHWIKAGLPAMAKQKPHLIAGEDARAFLTNRRQSGKKPCGPGELYCLRCRAPRTPVGNVIQYLPITLLSGNMRGLCDACETPMYRRVSLSKVVVVAGRCSVVFPEQQQRLSDSPRPSLNCHLATYEMNDDDKAE